MARPKKKAKEEYRQTIEEIQNNEPPGPTNEPSNAPSKRRGRPKNENYLPWEEARTFVRGELIPSRTKYEQWWERNKPKAIPRFPYRVYVNEWVSWNDFLGNDNKFNEKIGTNWLPLDEAANWVHTLKLQTYTQWIEYCRETDLPERIPARPELVYKGWKSWSHWLGNKPSEIVAVQRELARQQVYYIIHERGMPDNVFTYGIDPNGLTNLKERWQQEHFDVVRTFWYDSTHSNEINNVINSLSSPYMGLSNQRLTPNVWNIIAYIEMKLDTIRRA